MKRTLLVVLLGLLLLSACDTAKDPEINSDSELDSGGNSQPEFVVVEKIEWADGLGDDMTLKVGDTFTVKAIITAPDPATVSNPDIEYYSKDIGIPIEPSEEGMFYVSKFAPIDPRTGEGICVAPGIVEVYADAIGAEDSEETVLFFTLTIVDPNDS